MKGIKHVVFLFFIWRSLLFLPLLAGFLFIPYRSDYDYTNILNIVSENSQLRHFFIYPWANFDGVHYLAIATNNYSTDGRFFPLYPFLINLISFEFSPFLFGFLLSNISFLIGLIILFNIVKKEYTQNIANQTIIFILLFPASFFFVSLYTEGLFLLLLILSFYFIHEKRWVISAFFILLLTLTKFLGVFLIPVLIYQFFNKEKILEKFREGILSLKDVLTSSLVVLTPAGLIGFSIYSFYKWGDFLNFLNAHGNQGNSRETNSVIFPLQTIFRYIKILILNTYRNYEWWIALLELSLFIFGSLLLYLAWRKKIKKMYLFFGSFAFLIPALSGTFSGLPRYMIVIFPIFVAMALIKNKVFKILYAIISPILLFILLMFFSRGYFIA